MEDEKSNNEEEKRAPQQSVRSEVPPRHFLRLGFLCGLAKDNNEGKSRLEQKITEQRQLQQEESLRMQQAQEKLTALNADLNAAVNEGIELNKIRYAQHREREAEYIERSNALAEQLIRLRSQLAELQRSLGVARSTTISAEIERAGQEVDLLLKKQEELNSRRQKMFNDEFDRQRQSLTDRANLFKQIKERYEALIEQQREWARGFGTFLFSPRAAQVLMAAGVGLSLLAGEFLSQVEVKMAPGATRIVQYLLGNVIKFFSGAASGDAKWNVAFKILLGWSAFLLVLHILILLCDWLIGRASNREDHADPNLTIELDGASINLKHGGKPTASLYVRWLHALPWLFVLGLILIVTADHSTFEHNAEDFAEQVVGASATFSLAVLCYLIVSRLAPSNARTAKNIQRAWLGLIILLACAVSLRLAMDGVIVNNAFSLPGALFLLTSMTAAFAFSMGMLLSDARDAERELRKTMLAVIDASARASYPGTAGFVLRDHDVILGQFTELQARIMKLILERAKWVENVQIDRFWERVVKRLEKDSPNFVVRWMKDQLRKAIRSVVRKRTGHYLDSVDADLFPELVAQINSIRAEIERTETDLGSVRNETEGIRTGKSKILQDITNGLYALFSKRQEVAQQEVAYLRDLVENAQRRIEQIERNIQDMLSGYELAERYGY